MARRARSVKLRAQMERDPERLRAGPMAVLAAIVERVINDYGPALDGFEMDALEVERDVFSDTRAQPVRRLYKLKREVRELLVAIDSLQDPLNRLMRVLGSQLPEEVLADLSEAADQLDRTVVRTQSLSGLLDAALDGQPRPDLGAAERRHAQDQRMGRHGSRADIGRRHLRHELRHLPRTALAVRLPTGAGWHGRGRPAAVSLVQAQRLVLTLFGRNFDGLGRVSRLALPKFAIGRQL